MSDTTTELASRPVFVCFDGSPSPEAGRFIEVETADGKSVKAGEWEQEGDYWYLGPFYREPPDIYALRAQLTALQAERDTLTATVVMMQGALDIALPRLAHKQECCRVRPAAEWADHGSTAFDNCNCEIRTVKAALATLPARAKLLLGVVEAAEKVNRVSSSELLGRGLHDLHNALTELAVKLAAWRTSQPKPTGDSHER